MGFPLYVTCCFSLAAFNILSLCLVFVSLIRMCLGVVLLGLILYGTLCASWTWLTTSVSMLGKFSTIISSKFSSYPFFFSSSSGTPIIQMLVHLILSQRSLRLSLVLFIPLLYSAFQKLFPSFYLPAQWFILLLQIFCYWFLLFLISVIVLFVSVSLFFNSSRSLLIDSCIFSSVFKVFDHLYYHYSELFFR